jgi:hypothetical protein
MAKKEPELDNKEKRAVKEWQGEISKKVNIFNKFLKCFFSVERYLVVRILKHEEMKCINLRKKVK